MPYIKNAEYRKLESRLIERGVVLPYHSVLSQENLDNLRHFGKQAVVKKKDYNTYPLVKFQYPYPLPVHCLVGCGGVGTKVKNVKYCTVTLKSKV